MRPPLLDTKRLTWTLKRGLIRLRWPGYLGAALVAVAVGFALFAVQPARKQLRLLEAQRVDLSARDKGAQSRAEPPTQRSQLTNFYAFFPLTEAVPEMLGKVQRAAQRNELTLAKGEYKLSEERDFHVASYQITLPVRGRVRAGARLRQRRARCGSRGGARRVDAQARGDPRRCAGSARALHAVPGSRVERHESEAALRPVDRRARRDARRGLLGEPHGHLRGGGRADRGFQAARGARRPGARSSQTGELDLERLRRGPSARSDRRPVCAARLPAAAARGEASDRVARGGGGAAPPPPPQAPPLPFAYLGKLAEGDNTTVFLSMGDRNLVVRTGDVIDNNYRVEEVTDAAVVLTYLPLTMKQTLPIGAKQ